MNSFPKVHLVVAALGCLLVGPAAADRIKFRVLVDDEELLSKPLCYYNGSRGEPLENLSKVRRSEAVTFNGKGRSFLIGFLGGNPGSIDEPFMPEDEFVRVDVPEEVKEPLVVLFAEGEEKKAAVLEDSAKVFKKGDFRLHNLTSENYLVDYGGEQAVELNSGESMALELSEDTGMFELKVSKADEPEKMVYSSLWSQQKTARKLALLTTSRHGVSISVVSQVEDE